MAFMVCFVFSFAWEVGIAFDFVYDGVWEEDSVALCWGDFGGLLYRYFWA
jgi:hypothetical protein